MSAIDCGIDRIPAPAPRVAPGLHPESAAVELAVIVPTLNEHDNVALLVDRLNRALAGLRWEVIFVDDNSADGTADAVRALAQNQGNVRCLQRLGRRGLASACIEGALASAAPYIAVMDGDLQHDETLLPVMLGRIKAEGRDIIVASRYVAEGSLGEWQKSRVLISDVAGRLGRLVVKAALSDPMSGFFLVERQAFAACAPALSGQGYKILLDLFASSPRPLDFAEVPLNFRPRLNGESKLDALVAWEYLMLLLQKLVGPLVPVRFLLFSMIGAFGLVIHLSVLWTAAVALGVAFPVAQGLAALTAMTGNFFLNNFFTYRDRRLRGRRLATGLLSFYAVCGLGAAANIDMAARLYEGDHSWLLAGLGGAAVSAVWNYVMSSIVTWRAAAAPARKRPSGTAVARAAAVQTGLR